MVRTTISREKLYRREYQRDEIITMDIVAKEEEMLVEGFSSIISLMIKEGGRN